MFLLSARTNCCNGGHHHLTASPLVVIVAVIVSANLVQGAGGGEKEPVCDQKLLERSIVTQCGPSLCEPLSDSASSSGSSGGDGSDGSKSEPKKEDGTGGGVFGREWPMSKDQVVHIVSSRAGHRFKVNVYKTLDSLQEYYDESHVNGTLFADPQVGYQRVLGFGTSLTDASCRNADDIPSDIRAQLIEDYFSSERGIGLNLLKLPIGSTRFSYTNYVLDQPDGSQVELSPYDLEHRIPLVKEALVAAGKHRSRIKLLASATTAPAEMKQNNKMIHGGYLRANKYADYASYLLGYVAAYRALDLNIWSLILSEAPATNGQLTRRGEQGGGGKGSDKDAENELSYASLAMKPSDCVKLISAINEQRATNRDLADINFRMLLLGDAKAFAPSWADALLGQHEQQATGVAQSVAGLVYTCDATPYDNLAYVTKRYPNKYLLASQAPSATAVPAGEATIELGNWAHGEALATEMVKNFQFGSVGWLDGNLALNMEGGPNLSDKFKSNAAVVVNAKRALYYRQPSFYALGHLSRYVKPGSLRVKSNIISSAHMYAHQQVAFVTPDNYLIIFVANNNIGPMPLSVGVGKRTRASVMLETKSFNTFIIRL